MNAKSTTDQQMIDLLSKAQGKFALFAQVVTRGLLTVAVAAVLAHYWPTSALSVQTMAMSILPTGIVGALVLLSVAKRMVNKEGGVFGKVAIGYVLMSSWAIMLAIDLLKIVF